MARRGLPVQHREHLLLLAPEMPQKLAFGIPFKHSAITVLTTLKMTQSNVFPIPPINCTMSENRNLSSNRSCPELKYFSMISSPSVLVSQGCYNKVLHTGWFK